MSTTDEFIRLMATSDGHTEEPAPHMPGLHLGVVVSATVDSLRFTIPSYSETLDFGPAPYPRPINLVTSSAGDPAHTHDVDSTPVNVPPRGTEVAVFFAGGDLGKPYVVCLFGWPT